MTALEEYRHWIQFPVVSKDSIPVVPKNLADAAIAELKATNKRLNRRAQRAESAVLEKVQTHPDASFGRILANAGYHIELERAGQAEAELATAREKAQALVDQMNVVHDSLDYQGVWTVAHIHRGQYCGPQYTEELEDLASYLRARAEAEKEEK